MKAIPLKEFQELCALSDRALVHLLHSNQIRCEVIDGALMVDTDSVEISDLIHAIGEAREEYWRLNSTLLSERLAGIVSAAFSKVIERTLSELQLRNK